MIRTLKTVENAAIIAVVTLIIIAIVFWGQSNISETQYAFASETGANTPRVAFAVNGNEMFMFDNMGTLLPQTVTNSLPAISVDGSTYVPVKEFCSAMGYSVGYSQENKKITISYMGKSLELAQICALADLTKENQYFSLHGNSYTKIQNIAAFENLDIAKKNEVLLLYGGGSSASTGGVISDTGNVFTVQENKLVIADEFMQMVKKSAAAPKEDYGATLQKAYDVVYYKPFVNPYVPYSYAQMQTDIEKLKEQYPEYIKSYSAGKSVEGRDLTTIEFGNGNKHIYVFGSHHAREYISTSYIMKFVNETAYGAKTGVNKTKFDVKNMLNRVTFHIIPMLNPDGVNLVQNGIESVSPAFREKVRAMPINDGNGYSAWKANINGVDLNRNYPTNWVPLKPNRASSRYAGVYPGSEPEVQAAMNYMNKYPMDVVVSMHSQGQLYYWSNTEWNMGEMGRKIVQASGFRPIMDCHGPNGGYLSNYVNKVYGKYEMTIELCEHIGPYPYPDAQFDKVWAPAKDILLIVGDEVGRIGEIAEPTTAKMSLNTEPKSFEAYNINESNYFKLRDLAAMMKGDQKQFDVSWNAEKNEIIVTKNQEYSGNAEETTGKTGRTKIAHLSDAQLTVDGNKVSFPTYNIDQNNYFKLRDIMKLLDVSVEWNNETKTIVIDTSRAYGAAANTPLVNQTTEGAITELKENSQLVPVKDSVSLTESRVNAYIEKNPGMSQEEALWKIKVNMDKPEFTGAKVLTNEELSNMSVMVNKRQRVPDNYKPSDLVSLTGRVSLRAEAKNAFEKMAADAKSQGFIIKPVSGFRTVQYQDGLYKRYLKKDSFANVETYSARPGYSEHHTGLALDVAGSNNNMENFGASKESPWVAENAHKYGWIVRYLPEASYITGYKSEPWHLRYVGVDMASKMKNQGIKTLEEYLGRNVL